MKDSKEQCQRSEGEFFLPCGNEEYHFKLNKAEILDNSGKIMAMSEDEIDKVLFGEAVMSYPLEDVIAEAEKILIVLPDATRLSGAEQILPMIMDKIVPSGADFHFIIACGTHRQPSEDELKKILTEPLYKEYKDRILPQDAADYSMMDFYGITKRKTPVMFNKAYREHDTIISIGSVSYHYFAGYGGGRKMLFPGLASEKSITANHRLALDEATGKRNEYACAGNLKNNPVHDDLVEAVMIARSAHTFFAVNTILDGHGRISDMVCGDIFMSHLKAAEMLDEYCLYETDEKFDLLLVSAGGFPKDINMVQAQKYLDRIVPLLKSGASVVFFAECADGYGNKYFQEFFDLPDSKTMLKSLMLDYKINRQTAFNLKSRLEAYKVYLVSSFGERDATRMGFVKAEPDIVYDLAEHAERIGVVAHPSDIFIRTKD